MASDNIVELTDDNFQSEVVNSKVPALVDFWAEWCMPCRQMAPVVEALATEYADRLKVGKLNTDSGRQTAMQFNITGIPTLLLFKGGKVVKKMVGVQTKSELKSQIDAALV